MSLQLASSLPVHDALPLLKPVILLSTVAWRAQGQGKQQLFAFEIGGIMVPAYDNSGASVVDALQTLQKGVFQGPPGEAQSAHACFDC